MAWVGPLGGLVEVRAPRGIAPSVARATTYRTTLGGVRKAHQAPRALRQLAVDLSYSTPEQVANLAALVSGEYGSGPFWYVDPWAAVTNLLTPTASTLEPGSWTTTGTVTAAGAVPLVGGGRAGRSLAVASTADQVFLPRRNGARDDVPVVPGRPVTASVYATGAAVSVRIQWVDAAGAGLSSVTAGGSFAGPELGRVAVSAMPPPGAAAMYVVAFGASRLARPAVTWTDEARGWYPGQGMPRCLFPGLDTSVVLAHDDPDGRGAQHTFTVMEVG
ncbi:hypothetical protein [Cellulosimicrobium sp. I38E]|uniref:hypothetical protein n=1 Tax=Cellulosimicrobium sp. I38E TaxID=1393139 RepID=UPI0007B18458|nr:hypothetical protein [Cellulosimicrobium sp. I38E]KZM78405.1 hypothetical protein A0J59_13830 [Cellulosimicrobium sp. I38E]